MRFSSYGYVSFPELARDARRVPTTSPSRRSRSIWWRRAGAVGVFRELPAELSLVVHGNDHVHRELERCREAGGGRANGRGPRWLASDASNAVPESASIE